MTKNTMKRVIRNERLTPAEAAKYRAICEQVALEVPELISRHQQRLARDSRKDKGK